MKRLMRLLKRLSKQAYSVLALFALIHILTLVGLAGFAWSTGRIDRQKVEIFAALLRGEEVQGLEQVPGSNLIGGPSDSAETSEKKIKEALEVEDVIKLKRDRAITDLKQQERLLDRRMIALQNNKEEFKRLVSLAKEQRRKREERQLSDAYKKTIDTISGMKDKNARDHLMQSSDSDVVKILLEMEGRQTQRILNSCKTQTERAWRDRMLNLMRQQPPELAGGSKP